MTENRNFLPTGGPAYPTYPSGYSQGMTLRDYFAAQALQGMSVGGPGLNVTNAKIAEEAYALADAMLEARK